VTPDCDKTLQDGPRDPWWKGSRGEWFVVVQFFLFALVAFGPRTMPGWPPWPAGLAAFGTVAGLLLMVAGAALAGAGVLGLGSNLTALPHPRDCSELVTTGPYAIVRHPIYSGLILGSFGIALYVHGWLSLVWAAVLFAFFDVKSRIEERWLSAKFSDYAAYTKRVRKLIPWVY